MPVRGLIFAIDGLAVDNQASPFMPSQRNQLRRIPAVEKVLQHLKPTVVPRPLIVKIIREELASIRKLAEVPDEETILQRIADRVADMERTRIQPVINATGVVIHTNLGRAPLGADVIAQIASTGSHYNNLEFDLRSGQRGSRGEYVENCLAALCNAEAATVVNNCAAALVLILRHFTGEKPEVVISRGELVQIGGGFRIPDILETSGATLKEVGTTNRTTISDYSRAVGKQTGLILKVHRSNFFIEGFVEAPTTAEIAEIARKKRVPFVEDLGSGALFATETISGLEHEPTPGEVLRAGAGLVCFSGDKLMGGPQAGIIAGRAKHIRALKKDPFFRVLRCDKLILTALQATAERTLNSATKNPPDLIAHELLSTSVVVLKRRAQKLAKSLAGLPVEIKVARSKAEVGGGTLPRSEIDSVAVSLKPLNSSARELATRLRACSPPIIGTVANGTVNLDLRTVFPHQDTLLQAAVTTALARA
jgi:L-seryl-tRNA(Ser) seleniumtransferase